MGKTAETQGSTWPGQTRVLGRAQLDGLLGSLNAAGYRVIGPRARDGAIVYAEIAGVADLPIGWTDRQAPGRYRLEQTGSNKLFGYVVGPESPRRFLTPAVEPLVQIRRTSAKAEGLVVEAVAESDARPLALIGVRACDLAGMTSHDRIWAGGPFTDPRYARRREQALVIAVDCLAPGELCFCASTRTGPEARAGFDLRLTELDGEDEEPTLLLTVGSERGAALIEALGLELEPAGAKRELARRRGLEAATETMRTSGRSLDVDGAPAKLWANLDHPRWDQVAQRCLSCGNCTLVCPTCFCHRVEEREVVGEATTQRVREWDSCFTAEHSTIHGAVFRPQIRERYRQWMTHKLAGWVSQVGMSGCVGCGRCIAWCPVGIDITEELAAIEADPQPRESIPVPVLPAKTYAPVAGDPMRPQIVRVVGIERELPDAVTLAIEPAAGFRCAPGQFNMLSLPGVGEVAISISGERGAAILHTIRAVGATSRALAGLEVGAGLGIRGPFGSAWPLAEARGRQVVVIAGGLGLAPLRGALRELVGHPQDYPALRLLYGARSPEQVLYREEILAWDPSIRFANVNSSTPTGAHVKVHVTVDRGDPSWTGHVGVVTTLMRRKPLSKHAIYLVCGPETMMRFVLDELDAIGVPQTQTWLSMERNMKCAVGMCGRCQYGPHFVCKDGPVFRRDQIAALLGREGF
jgi:NAD(P)H-flavin reductase/Fe-S-cluster-containing hydrogenase component 2